MYFLKEKYIENLSPNYYQDVPQDIEYQHYVYQLASYLGKCSSKKYIIDLGSGNGQKLIKYFSDFQIITVDFGENSSFVNQRFEHITFNFDNGLPNIDTKILENSIVIASDVIEHLINPQNFIDSLNNWSKIVPYIVISTPDRNIARGLSDYGPPANNAHVREWSLQEFRELLFFNGFENFFIGYTENTNFHKQKATILALVGKKVNYKPQNLKKILAIINSYNEKDIIYETITHLLNQGIDVCFVDNHSNDGTYELVASSFQNDDRVIIRKSDYYGDNYEWYQLLKNTENISHEFSKKYDWFMHHDSDELRYSPFKNISMQEMISFVDSEDYNAIDFTVIDFRFTKNNDNITKEFEKNLLSFEFGRRAGHFQQVKCWKYTKDINLADSGGHNVEFQNKKVYPIKFLLKHYPLRNIEQAQRKIFQDRQKRIMKEKNEKGWHSHYDKFIKNEISIVFKDYQLLRWHQNIFDTEFIVERISGIGIERE